MEEQIARLAISEEEEEIFFEEVTDAPAWEEYGLCVVGYLVTDRNYNFTAFQNTMVGLWRPGRGVSIEEIGGKLLLIRFEHEVDLRRVIEGGPWSFDQNLLVLRELKSGEQPRDVEMYQADFWVQVHNLSAGFFSKTVGVALGNFVGTFNEYDERNAYTFRDPVMRIRVTLDIRKPLRRERN
ncbi:hypothetical protein LINPERHAP1_LOCUS39115 [Linum perenne]